MKNEIKIIRETNTHGGVTVSVLSVKYPLVAECEKISGFFCALAEKYNEFVKTVCFEEDKKHFDEYRKEGGRRSKFPKREYFFLITELRSGREGYITFKSEVFCMNGGIIVDYSLDYKTWKISTQTLCLAEELTLNRPKERFDGFYLCDGEVIFYKVIPLWRKKECYVRQIPSFETQLKVFKRRKRKVLVKNV